MTNLRSQRIIMALVAVVAVLVTLLAVQVLKDPMPTAYAQSEGVTAGGIVGILGPPSGDRSPLFLIDTKAQTILTYEYSSSTRQLYLRVARSYSADRDLEDASFGRTNVHEGPSVNEVRDLIRKQRPR